MKSTSHLNLLRKHNTTMRENFLKLRKIKKVKNRALLTVPSLHIKVNVTMTFSHKGMMT